jgi:hypothetical protein
MLYVDFSAGNKEYKLRLTTRATVALEKQLGCNPLGIFGKGDTIPTVTQMVAILHASLQQYHHGITLNDAYGIFDDYLADNNTVTDFIMVILEIYRASGLIKEEAPGEEEEKNA